MEEMIQLFPSVRVSKSIADWVRLMPWGEFIDNSGGTSGYQVTGQLGYLRPTEVGIIPGFNISRKFAKQLEEILEKKRTSHQRDASSGDKEVYSIETLSELHLREKDRIAHRIQQNCKYQKREYEHSLYLPKLRRIKPKPKKYCEILPESDTGEAYTTAIYERFGKRQEHLNISQLLEMPKLIVDPLSFVVGHPETPGQCMNLSRTIKYRIS